MCGIAGMTGKRAHQRTREMIQCLRHRGPDGIGIWDGPDLPSGGEVSMGHAHLKVTGDTPQPVYQDGKAMVYNGEIYNFDDFLKGTSDTAALASIILKDGLSGFAKAAPGIDGEYAFAVYADSGMMLARDPVGIKPLFYGISDDGFGFASEQKALRKVGFKDIRPLPPGSIYCNGSEHRVMELPTYRPEIRDETEAIRALDTVFARAVTLRTHKDAAIAFSGGVDCSLAAAIADEAPLCTIGLKGSYDIKAARHAARLMGAEKRHIIYEIDEREVEGVLPGVIYAVESSDPMKVAIALPLFVLARCARSNGFKVLISGQGADELFGGYARYESVQKEGRLAEALQSDLRHLAEVNLERDDATTMAHGVELRVPYLDMEVIKVSQRIDPSLKVYFNGKDYIRKYILRKLSEKYLPHDVSFAPKKAIQYGTNVQKVLEKLARDNGYRGDLAGYLNSLYRVVFKDGDNQR